MKRCSLLVALLALLATPATAKNAATFDDPAGDASAGAPDLTTVRVSNDDVHQLTFEITLSNRPSFGANDRVVVWMDVDRDPFTGRTSGAAAGADFSVSATGVQNPLAQSAVLTRWNLDTGEALPQVRVHFGYDTQRRVLTLSFNQFALGRSGDFTFTLQSFAPGSIDNAPDTGSFAYQVIGDRTAPVVRASGASAKRGRSATLRYRIEDDNPTSETVTITRAGRRVARLTRALRPFTQTNVTVRWRVPQGLAPGQLHYCVVAIDESRNRSRPGCAGIRVK